MPREMLASDLGLPICSACGGFEHLRTSRIIGEGVIICKPCFMVWYDPDEMIDVTDPAQVGALSLKLKAAGKYPWTEVFAQPRTPEGTES